MYCRGNTQQAIADYLEVTRQQIGYDLKIVFGRWQESAVANIEERKAAELEKVNQLERTYWDAWERSLKPKESRVRKAAKMGDSEDEAVAALRTSELKTEQRDGNPSYLEGVRWCIEQRCKILGLNAPTKVDVLAKVDASLEDVAAATKELEGWERDRFGASAN